jgi:hypothetical protein
MSEDMAGQDVAIAHSLAKLTAGWTAADEAQLTAAREALAGALLAGHDAGLLHANPAVATTPIADPGLLAQLESLAARVKAAPAAPIVPVVRTPLAAAPSNPAGIPAWARSAQVLTTLGPFTDAAGVWHWIDLLPITVSNRFAFGDASSPFAVLPLFTLPIEPMSPLELELGAGSVWFLASLLSPTFPAGAFTGFTVTGGKLTSSAALALGGDTYVAPLGATLTLEAAVAPAAAAAPGADAGPDGAAATFTPPAVVTLEFTQSAATFNAVADSSASAYGTTVDLHWTGAAPALGPELPQVLVPCTASAASFSFATVASELFEPAGTATVTGASWALPLAAVPLAALPESAGPGAGEVLLGAGATVATGTTADPLPVDAWTLEIGSGALLVAVDATAKPASTTFELWAERPPSQRRSSVAFATRDKLVLAALATTSAEIVVGAGSTVAHLDRPLSADGARIPFKAAVATLVLARFAGAEQLVLLASRQGADARQLSLALENALMAVSAPVRLVLAGTLGPGGALSEAAVALEFGLRWLMPTLPDPYASSFDVASLREQAAGAQGATVLATIRWDGAADAVMSCALLPAVAGGAAPTLPTVLDRGRGLTALALLDLSTNVDLFGVALAPGLGAVAERGIAGEAVDVSAGAQAQASKPPFALQDMSLAFNGALAVTFALPQVSWEPMEVAPVPAGTRGPPPGTPVTPEGPLAPAPASDGPPLLLSAPDNQQLVPFAPEPVLTNNIHNVATGHSFYALFSLPFGLEALISEPRRARGERGFLQGNVRFERQIPRFSVSGPEPLSGAVALTLEPRHAAFPNGKFSGVTIVTDPYGTSVLGGDVAAIFSSEFDEDPHARGVPLRRIDLSGYGASIFSDWTDPSAPATAVIKAQFETSIGRTAFEVIKVQSLLFPYCVKVVRTVTIERQTPGWVLRSDSGWRAASDGTFAFPAGRGFDGRVHTGALTGVYNVRNIGETGPIEPVSGYDYQPVLFDADIGVDPSLKLRSGGSGGRVPSQRLVGYVQLTYGDAPLRANLKDLFDKAGPFTPAISCTVEAGAFPAAPGTILRCSAFEISVVERSSSAPVPALAAALRGAPTIPRAGGWGLGRRGFRDTAPAALPGDFPVPLVQPAGPAANKDFWHVADVADVLALDKPTTYYSLLHSTGTHKVLFESPQIPTSPAAVPPGTSAGLQFPKPPPPLPGGTANQGSPNLGDLAAILNSTGLFPSLGAAISLLAGAAEQIETTTAGFKYSKTHDFDPAKQSLVLDAGVLNIKMQYADTRTTGGNTPARLSYEVDSSANPSWTLKLGPLSFLVAVPALGGGTLLTITGSFYADEHTKPGLSGLQVELGDTLRVVKDVFSHLQALAQYLPGGAGANLDVAVSDGRLTVTDTFTISQMPLGIGELTDISLDLGLAVTLSPLSADFLVGIGSPNNPFNWVVSPLAGNGLIDLGAQNSSQAIVIQAGLGLGLAINLAIASGSASITIAFELEVKGSSVELMAILTGRASVDVLDGLASATVTLSAGLGFEVSPADPVTFNPLPPKIPTDITIGPETITLHATCSVGIHLQVCWLVSVSWDGSWAFQKSVDTPKLHLSL